MARKRKDAEDLDVVCNVTGSTMVRIGHIHTCIGACNGTDHFCGECGVRWWKGSGIYE